MKWFKFAAHLLLWLLVGVILLALFTAILWFLNGEHGGYPALFISVVFFLGLVRSLYQKAYSVRGIFLRLLPTGLALLIIIWAMIPMAPQQLEDYPLETGFELWELDNSRSIVIHHATPPASGNITPKDTAIVFIHGGPGAYTRTFTRNYMNKFTLLGYDVYTYDQVGAGLSPIVPVEEYSHFNNVTDLASVIERIDKPIILIGQSYGAGMAVSYLDRFKGNHPVTHLVLTEPSPVPGKELPDDPRYHEITTKAEHIEDPSPLEVVDSPRFLFAMLLPAENRFVPQQELMNYIGPEVQKKITATAFCKKDKGNIPDFRKLRINLKAHNRIKRLFGDEKQPELQDLEIPVLLLLGECSNLPRGFAMDYFEILPIQRSHLIRGGGHVLWANKQSKKLTRKAIISFLKQSEELPLPNEPTADTRMEFVKAGK